MNFSVLQVLQVIVAIGLLNVWLLRGKKQTRYRGGEARTLKEEFSVYGLPVWFFYLVGLLKVLSALLLLIGLFFPEVVLFASLIVTFLMLGAVCMHFKVSDPILKAVPASMMMLMSTLILFSTF